MTPIDERSRRQQSSGDDPRQHGAGRAGHNAPDEYSDSGGPVGDVDPEEIVAHEDRFAGLEAEVEEWKGKYQRALADFQNFQRRSIENEREARRQGVSSVVMQLLGVLDNFDLALSAGAASGSSEQILQGVSMIRQQLLQALSAIDVASIQPAAGDEFDPHRHEAVAQVDAEGVDAGRVAATFQTGYRLGDRVLRPAKVSVAKAPESTERDSSA